MAILRVTLLVAMLLGLGLLATPRHAVAALVPGAAYYTPVPGAAAYLQCMSDWHPCTYYRQRCAECVVSCREAKKKSPMIPSVNLALDTCLDAQA